MSQIPKAPIYTKKGDQGTTSLVDGNTVPKDHPRVEAYGDVDELNSHLGLLIESLKSTMAPEASNSGVTTLLRIQNHLFNVGSLLACEDVSLLARLPQLSEDHVRWLEEQIDTFYFELPKLNEFILPGGHPASAQAHVARTVCRRAERHVSRLPLFAPEYGSCLIYLNRLSDFLFTLARWIHLKTQTPEVKWDSKA